MPEKGQSIDEISQIFSFVCHKSLYNNKLNLLSGIPNSQTYSIKVQ